MECDDYYGVSHTKIDDKGRIILPRRIRQRMDEHDHVKWYLTRGFDGCVFLHHPDGWRDIRDQARQYSSMDGTALDFRRVFFSSLAEAKPDRQGRMPVAQHLRDLAGIEREAVLVGVGDHMELWDPGRWETFLASKNEAEFRKMASPLFRREAAQGAELEKGGQGDEG